MNKELVNETERKTKCQQRFTGGEEFNFLKNESIPYEKFLLQVEEGKKEMQNLIHFKTVTNSDRELVSQPREKLKNKEHLIHADEFSFHEIKSFLIKSPSSE